MIRTENLPFIDIPTPSITPIELRVIGTVDECYQSYNVEMVEVTGGRFWRPYDSDATESDMLDSPARESVPEGMDASLYEYRPPLDLYNTRLRKLAKALGPTYVRVSGTWSNRTYVPEIKETAPEHPPSGYGGVLTQEQWKGVIDFCQAVDGKLVTSFAIGAGVRDEHEVWTPVQAQRLLALTQHFGASIRAAEFFNEPNLASLGGAPDGYTPADYARDFHIFREYIKEAAPEIKIAGPGSVLEAIGDWVPQESHLPVVPTPLLLEASGGEGVDMFSYHHYGALSKRCDGELKTTAEDALSEEWLRRTDDTLAFYKPLRDRYTPSIPFWLTETAQAACGGSPWANTFLDTFRYLDQLGRLAKQEVTAVMHNTLIASDYSLIHEPTLTPKPNYWGALLWNRFMGETVLDSGIKIQEGLHLYAHSLSNTPGGIALLAINNSRTHRSSINLPVGGNRYTLSAHEEQAKQVLLNGIPLTLDIGGKLPQLLPASFQAGRVTFEPTSITFLTLPNANNPDCP